MRLSKSLIFLGAGLLLTACGGGGDDPLGSKNYDDDIVVRVMFENGDAFKTVAAVDGNYSLLMVTLDVDDDGEISQDDLRLTYVREYRNVSGDDEYYRLLRYDDVEDRFEPITEITSASFSGDTMEWVIDQSALEAEMDMSSVITDETELRVEAIKVGSTFFESEDLIPNEGLFVLPDLVTGLVEDDVNDFEPPSGGTSAVDLSSVRVLFFD